MAVKTIGLDIAKHVFQVHGADASGKAVLKKRLRREQVTDFFGSVAPCVVAMEATRGAHYWARVIGTFGHEVRLIAPRFVKPYVRGQKNDMQGAAGTCEGGKPADVRRQAFFPLRERSRSGPVWNVGIAERFPRTVESDVCFPSVRHFHRLLFARRFLFGFLGLFDSIARDIQFEDHAMMHEAVNRRCCRHRIFEDALPLREGQVARDQNTAPFVPLCQQCKQDFHFFAALLHVPEVVDNQALE